MKITFTEATSHQLAPVDDENVPKKARVARNVSSIRVKNGVTFDVNDKTWPKRRPDDSRNT